MLNKSILKAAVLLMFLFLIMYFSKCTSSSEFKNSLNNFFVGSSQKLKWCPDYTVDFKWSTSAFVDKWSQADSKTIQKMFCTITVDSFVNNEPKFKFGSLLVAYSAEGKSAELQWDSATMTFKVQEIIFTSSELVQKLK